MKILLINGSPKGKRSNSLKLAYSFIEGFKNGCTDDEESISIDELHVASMNIAACKGCFACWQKTPGICCIKDDMQKVIGKLIDADLILWSFPLYYFNVPGILKNLIDRQLPMSLPFMSSKQNGYGSGSHDSRYDMEGKRHVLISTCGFYSAVGNYDSVLRMFDHFLGKGNYTTIFCGQGELFRVKELSARMLIPWITFWIAVSIHPEVGAVITLLVIATVPFIMRKHSRSHYSVCLPPPLIRRKNSNRVEYNVHFSSYVGTFSIFPFIFRQKEKSHRPSDQ